MQSRVPLETEDSIIKKFVENRKQHELRKQRNSEIASTRPEKASVPRTPESMCSRKSKTDWHYLSTREQSIPQMKTAIVMLNDTVTHLERPPHFFSNATSESNKKPGRKTQQSFMSSKINNAIYQSSTAKKPGMQQF